MNQSVIPALCPMEETQRQLLALYCAQDCSQEALAAWLACVNFDTLPSQITCMASAAAAKTGFDRLPPAVTPRLRGLIKYIRTLNAGMYSALWLLANGLREAGIPALAQSETALYLLCPEAPQRQLWQLRVAVPRESYESALEAAEKIGFQVERRGLVAVARYQTTRWIVIAQVADWEKQSAQAVEVEKHNARLLCPSLPALLLELCQDAFRALTKDSCQGAVVCWLMDLQVLLRLMTEENWETARKMAENDHLTPHIRLLFALRQQLTGCACPQAESVGTLGDAEKLASLLLRLRACPSDPKDLRRRYLLHRLRRPDSLVATGKLILGRLAQRGKRS